MNITRTSSVSLALCILAACDTSSAVTATDTTGPSRDDSPMLITDDAGCVGRLGDLCLRPTEHDRDGDGFDDTVDCNDFDPAVRPGAFEQPCNGEDDDCTGGDRCGDDGDGDGYTVPGDCDDSDPARNPLATEVYCDGVDNNCDGYDSCDVDGDGSVTPGDCDDHDPDRGDTLPELVCDGIDNDCRLGDCCDNDADGDGVSCRDDCDDLDQLTYPGAPVPPGCYRRDVNCDGVRDGLDC